MSYKFNGLIEGIRRKKLIRSVIIFFIIMGFLLHEILEISEMDTRVQ